MIAVRADGSALLVGDTVMIRDNQTVTIKYVEGPDHIGAYEIGYVDAQGIHGIEIVTEPITLLL
jgi:hypothetical protein